MRRDGNMKSMENSTTKTSRQCPFKLLNLLLGGPSARTRLIAERIDATLIFPGDGGTGIQVIRGRDEHESICSAHGGCFIHQVDTTLSIVGEEVWVEGDDGGGDGSKGLDLLRCAQLWDNGSNQNQKGPGVDLHFDIEVEQKNKKSIGRQEVVGVAYPAASESN